MQPKEPINLETLYLADSQVTDAGVAELRKALPHCKITIDHYPPLLPLVRVHLLSALGRYVTRQQNQPYGWLWGGLAGLFQRLSQEVAPPLAGPKSRGSFSAIVPLNNPWELRAFGVTQQALPPFMPRVRVRLLATRGASRPLYWWRLDTPTEGAAHETSAAGAAGDSGRGLLGAGWRCGAHSIC